MGRHKIVSIMLIISISMFGQLPKDKQLHFGAGAVIAVPSRMIAYSETNEHDKAFLWSMLSVTSIGLAKEIKDEIDYKGFDIKDLGASVLGGLIINLSFEIFKNKNKHRPQDYYYTSSPQNNKKIKDELIKEEDTELNGLKMAPF